MYMSYMRITLCIGAVLATLCCSTLSLAASGSWTSLRQLPQKNAGVRLEQPVAIAIDAAVKRYYVVDAANGQLVSFDQDGKFLSAFTAGDQLKKPVAMARTSTGILWVIERSSNELFYINPKQKEILRFAPKYADGSRVFMSRLALDANDQLYVLDRMKGQIIRLDDNLNIVQTLGGSADFSGFVDFKLRANSLWGLDALSAQVVELDLTGEVKKLIKLNGLQFPIALEVDRSRQLYLLDRHAGTVVVYRDDGTQKFTFLGNGKRPGQLWSGIDLLFDWEERLCVVDEGNGRVEVLTR
jgi:DNA-binding beta-propeller fold protein YncE